MSFSVSRIPDINFGNTAVINFGIIGFRFRKYWRRYIFKGLGKTEGERPTKEKMLYGCTSVPVSRRVGCPKEAEWWQLSLLFLPIIWQISILTSWVKIWFASKFLALKGNPHSFQLYGTRPPMYVVFTYICDNHIMHCNNFYSFEENRGSISSDTEIVILRALAKLNDISGLLLR